MTIFKDVLDRVFPPAPDFFALLNDQCEILVEAMEAFVAYTKTGKNSDGKKVRQLENRADELKDKIIDTLSSALTTQIDRGNVGKAVHLLDHPINYAKTTTKECDLFEVKPDDVMYLMAKECLKGAQALQKGFLLLKGDPDGASKFVLEAIKTERNVEKIYRGTLSILLDPNRVVEEYNLNQNGDKVLAVAQVMTDMIKWRELYRHMSNMADTINDAAEELHRIIVKTV
jgi:uncharacterized protein Yka (UPF0111/DUF47 family)